MKLKITHLSFSKTGGAGRVAESLSRQQRDLGHDANFMYLTDSNLKSDFMNNLPATLAAGFDNFVIKKSSHSSIISLTRDNLRGANFDGMLGGDILHLHWINGLGRTSVRSLASGFNSVFLTMHDMNPITAVCHHSLACQGYLKNCNVVCPAIRRPFQGTVSEIWKRKIEFYHSLPNFHFIAPSRWLEKEAANALHGLDLPVSYIPNPIEASLHKNAKLTLESRKTQNTELTFGFIANNINDPNKDLKSLLLVLKDVYRSIKGFRLLVAGNGTIDLEFNSLDFVEYLGPIDDLKLSDFYDKIDVLVVPSIAENSPLVIAEAACFGKIVIMRDIPAAQDFLGPSGMIDIRIFSSTIDLFDLIISALSNGPVAPNLKSQVTALEHFSPKNTTSKNLKLYLSSLGGEVG